MKKKEIKTFVVNRLFPRTRNALRSFLGIKELQEETDSLYYYLNAYVDIHNLPPTADSDLRILQKCDCMLLGIFDKMCMKYKLNYWIDWGTLLGAVRHKGFIPWDDDTDISMPRDDFNRACDVLSKELAEYGIDLYYKNNEKLSCLCLAYQHEKTGIWCDIIPMDEYRFNLDLQEVQNEIVPRIKKYVSYYDKNRKRKSVEELWKKKKALIKFDSDGNNLYCFHGQEFHLPSIKIFKKEDLMPVVRIPFENIELNAPANPKFVLRQLYGEHYMSFPHKGLEHHGGENMGRPLLKKWAKLHDVNMEDVYKHLGKVYSEL